MKNLSFTILAIALLVTATSFRSADPDPRIVRAFCDEFKNASGATWTKIPEGTTVSFLLNGSRFLAFYDNEGELRGTGRSVLFSHLPLTVMEALSNRFPGASFENIVEFTCPTESFYLLNAETNSMEFRLKAYFSGTLFIEKKTKREVGAPANRDN